MSGSFQVSDDFIAFEAEHQTAAQEAATMEKKVMGIAMPMNTSGVASICFIEAGKSKAKIDPVTKQPTGNHPMITVTHMVDTPTQYVGQKVKSYFTLNASEGQTVAQKYARFYDHMEACGMPKELRGKPLAEIFKWAGSEIRRFNYDIIPNYRNPNDKVFNPIAGVNTQLPSTTDIEKTMTGGTFTAGQMVSVAGNDCKVVNPQDPTRPDYMTVEFPGGQVMPVPKSNVVAK